MIMPVEALLDAVGDIEANPETGVTG